MDQVVEKMCRDLTLAGEKLRGAEIATLYVGGGTPSILPPALFSKLLKAARAAFPFAPNAECSCEMNPGTVTEAFLSAALEGGINRVSLGAQSASDRLLQVLGRIHTFEDVRRSVALLRASGFGNLNLDMMLGLPFQTLDNVRETLDAFLSLSPEHISCYGLIVEPGTKMEQRVQDGEWTLPDEDEEREMYELSRSTLESRGLKQYEISNFARPSFPCRHNVDCWSKHEYLGIGCAACGFIGNIRYKNPDSLTRYLRGDEPELTVLTGEDARFESVMLGLRMNAGVRDDEFTAMHGMSLRQAFGDKLNAPIADGLLTFDGGALRLTRRGMDVQNSVLVALM